MRNIDLIQAFNYSESPFEIINGVIVGQCEYIVFVSSFRALSFDFGSPTAELHPSSAGNAIESESLNPAIAQRFLDTLGKNFTFGYRVELEGKKYKRIIMETLNELVK